MAPVRITLLMSLYAAASWYLQNTHGHYRDSVWIYFGLFWAALALLISGEVQRQDTTHERGGSETFLLMSVVIFLCYLGSHQHDLIYARPNAWSRSLDFLGQAMLGLSVAAYALCHRSRYFALPMALIALLALASQLVTIKASPDPFIDVFVSNTSAAQYFLKGLNPYQQFYADIYHGAYDYRPGFLYFPGTLYWITPFQMLGDIRLGFVVANLLSAIGLFGIMRQRRAPREWSWLVAVAWLCFPVSKFVIEQGWTDPVIITFAIWAFWALGEKKIVATGALLGALCLFKQYAFVVSFFGLLAAYRQWGRGGAVKCFAALLIVFVGGMFPFLVWDFHALYFSTIKNQSDPKMRLDALTFSAYWVRNFSRPWPALASLILTAGTALLGALFLLSRWGRSLSAPWIAILATYGMAFFCGKWAFCNYHYLLAACFLMGLVLQAHPREGREAPTSGIGL